MEALTPQTNNHFTFEEEIFLNNRQTADTEIKDFENCEDIFLSDMNDYNS